MTITFLVVTRGLPMGGSSVLYEFANGMKRRGHDVHVVHLELEDGRRDGFGSVGDISWFSFEPGIHHHFTELLIESGSLKIPESYELPDADFVCHYDPQRPRRKGLPFLFIQGYRMLPKDFEHRAFRAPCPKVCVAKWLVDVGEELGVPGHELVHLPCGIDHEKYRLISPLEDRPPVVSMLYNPHPQKGPTQGLAALAGLKERIPEVEAVVFSSDPAFHDIPSWITFLTDPPQDVIVREIYNRSRVFLCSSRVEGLGLTSIEAMACGAALVTTSNGGSDDYAIYDRTALLCEPNDVSAMVDHMESLLRDDETRIRLARQGSEHVRKTFDWEASTEKLEKFLNGYGADPDRYLGR